MPAAKGDVFRVTDQSQQLQGEWPPRTEALAIMRHSA